LRFRASQAAPVMGRLRVSLVPAPPARPAEHLEHGGRVREREPGEQVPHLGHRQREERADLLSQGEARRAPRP
jgi:hypothetical protein